MGIPKYKPLYIFDIDGTIADCGQRLHYLYPEDGVKKDWDSFYEETLNDTPMGETIHTLISLYNAYNDIIFMTARSAVTYAATDMWIRQRVGISNPVILMRAEDDYRKDVSVKRDLYESLPEFDKERLVAVFEDRARVVSMWRSMGITCYQVNEGNY